MKKLDQNDFAKAASALGVPVAAVRAVTEVESKGSGFLPDGRPVILFERHVMYRQLDKLGIDANGLEIRFPTLVNSRQGGYKGGAAEHDRLGIAATFNRQAALESCSWGAFQVMGFHWKLLGYASVQDFVNAMYRSEGDQLDAFVRFIKANPNLLRALKAQDWAAFAAGYNGPAYRANSYDSKLAAAYARHAKELA